jgi:hypothetical protein
MNDLIRRLLNQNWDTEIGSISATALDKIGVIQDKEAEDEEYEWGLVYFPNGRDDTRTALILNMTSYEVIENILVSAATTQKIQLESKLHEILGRSYLEL